MCSNLNCGMSSFPTHKVIMYVFYKIVNVVQSGFWVTVLPVAVTIVIATYRIVSFSRHLNSLNGRFSVFSKFCHDWVCQNGQLFGVIILQ